MAKDVKKHKDKKSKGKKDKEIKLKNKVAKPAKGADDGILADTKPGNGAASGKSGYSDGHPQDTVQYLEAKLILKPDRFVSVESFRDFGKLVERSAKKLKVGFIAAPQTGLRPEIREILFGDTSDFRLYNSAFILRRRISYVDGFPVGDPEIVFKFRHPDEKAAAAIDVRPKIAGNYQIKFKAEVLPLKDAVGGYRLLYSHNCQFGLSQMHEGTAMAMGTLARVFPALADLKKDDDEKISLVNEGIVEEVLLPLGATGLRQRRRGQVRRVVVAHPRRTYAAGGRIRLSGKVPARGRCPREVPEAAGAVLHYPAERRGKLDLAGHNQDRHGLPAEGQRAAKP